MSSTSLVAATIALALCSIRAKPQSPQPRLQNISPPSSSALPASPEIQFAASVDPSTVNFSYVTLTVDPSVKSVESFAPALTSKSTKKSRSSHSDRRPMRPFSTFALGAKVGTLGAGVEIATPLARSFNLRAIGNYASLRPAFTIDGINYSTRVAFQSGQLGIDWFPFHGGFHISPGALYFHNYLAGTVDIDPGKPFNLDHVNYINSVDDPVSGIVSITYKQHIAPSLMIGFSNIIPRSGKHFSAPLEFGAAYTQAPYMDVKIAGTACTSQGCFDAATDLATQANLKGEVKILNETVSKLPFYPIVSLGFAIRF
jgi:hypothetical protein